jgi:IS605 OrfB family transposase
MKQQELKKILASDLACEYPVTTRKRTPLQKNCRNELFGEAEKPVLRGKRYELKGLEKWQISRLRRWFTIANWIYNLSINYIQQHGRPRNRQELRDSVRKIIDGTPKLMKKFSNEKFPADSRNEVIEDARKAYNSAFALVKQGWVKHFKIHPRDNSAPRQSFPVTEKCYSVEGIILPRSLGIKAPPELEKPTCQGRILMEGGRFYYINPEERPVKRRIRGKRNERCGVDPGIRKFLSVNDGKASYSMHPKRIEEPFRKIEAIESRGDPDKKRKIKKIEKKIRKRVDSWQWQTATSLVKFYDRVYFGNMRVQSIIARNKNLPKVCKRKLRHLRLYTFKCRLQSQAEKYGCKFVEVNEAYTSKTCGKCGEVNPGLGSSEIFRCPQPDCNFVGDRDFNAARSILLLGYASEK